MPDARCAREQRAEMPCARVTGQDRVRSGACYYAMRDKQRVRVIRDPRILERRFIAARCSDEIYMRVREREERCE